LNTKSTNFFASSAIRGDFLYLNFYIYLVLVQDSMQRDIFYLPFLSNFLNINNFNPLSANVMHACRQINPFTPRRPLSGRCDVSTL